MDCALKTSDFEVDLSDDLLPRLYLSKHGFNRITVEEWYLHGPLLGHHNGTVRPGRSQGACRRVCMVTGSLRSKLGYSQEQSLAARYGPGEPKEDRGRSRLRVRATSMVDLGTRLDTIHSGDPDRSGERTMSQVLAMTGNCGHNLGLGSAEAGLPPFHGMASTTWTAMPVLPTHQRPPSTRIASRLYPPG